MGLFDAMGRGGGVPGPENLWNGAGAPVDANGNYIPVSQQMAPPPPDPAAPPPPEAFPGAGTPDVWGGSNTGPFYDNPAAYPQAYPTPDPAGPGQQRAFYPTIFYPQSGTPPSGWFSLEDYYASQAAQRPDPNTGLGGEPGWDTEAGSGLVPWMFQSGSDLQNSTNDYRLLPPPYNVPGNFMINGRIISRTAGGTAPFSAPQAGQYQSGTGFHSGAAIGVPVAFTLPGWGGGTTYSGYPGDVTGYHGN